MTWLQRTASLTSLLVGLLCLSCSAGPAININLVGIPEGTQVVRVNRALNGVMAMEPRIFTSFDPPKIRLRMASGEVGSVRLMVDSLRQLLQAASDAMKERGEALATQEARLRAEVRRGEELAQQARGALAARDEAVGYAERLRQDRERPFISVTESGQRQLHQVRDVLLDLRLEMAAGSAPERAQFLDWQGRLQVAAAMLGQFSASLGGPSAG